MASLEAIRDAATRVYDVAYRTPLLYSHALSRRLGLDVYLKAECLQYTGSFKVRGAANRLAALTPAERERGVVAASAGNHAQGVAVAATGRGVPATVVMPTHATLAKIEATRGFGARVLLRGKTFGQPYVHAQELAASEGLTFISAFDDELIIAGQGTLGLEVVEQCPDASMLLVPVGGGGLIGGVAAAVKALSPATRIVGVQAAAAPGAGLSFASGALTRRESLPTIADGVAVEGPGELTLPLLRRYVDDFVTVDEESIAQAIVFLLENARLVVEGAGALGVAALLSGVVRPEHGSVVIVLSGGNIDINLLAAIVHHGLLYENRYLTLHVRLDDRPGSLSRLLTVVAASDANVLEVDHVRQGIQLPLRGVEVRLLLEVRDREHAEELTRALAGSGYRLIESTPVSRSFDAGIRNE